MTYNNLSNLYIKSKNYEKAEGLFQELLSLQYPGAKTNLAISYINSASLLSIEGNHEKALDYNLNALNILKDSPSPSSNILTSLVICFHNTAFEYCYLKRKQEYQKFMKEGWELSLEQLGPDHVLTHTIFQAFSESIADSSFNHIKIQKNLPIKPVPKEVKILEKILGNRPRNLSSENYELQNIRFLTGDRLQPMFRMGKLKNNSTRPSSRTSSATGQKSLRKKLTDPIKKELEIPEFKKNFNQISEKISEKISELQEKVDTFKEGFLPLKVLAEESEEPLSSKVSLIGKLENTREDYGKIQENIKNKAAIDIQKNVKGWKVRKDVRKKMESEKKACKVIGKAFKGFLGKEILKGIKEGIRAIKEVRESEEDDVTSEKIFEKNTEKPQDFKGILESISEAEQETNINSEKQGDLQKKEKTYEEKIVFMQAFMRKRLAMEKYRHTRNLIIKLQATIRMWGVRKLYKSIQEAVIFIQSSYRGHLVRKALKTNSRPSP